MDLRKFLSELGLVATGVLVVGCAGADFQDKTGYSSDANGLSFNLGQPATTQDQNQTADKKLVHSKVTENGFQNNLASANDHALMERLVFDSVPVLLPADGPVTSKFGFRKPPMKMKKAAKARHAKHRHKISSEFHKGIDIAARSGSTVIASGSGIVLEAGYDRGYGNYINIDHGGGLISRYAHAKALFVRSGDLVSAGSPIAAVGSSGHATGPHLHFEILLRGKHIDPERYLRTQSSSIDALVQATRQSQKLRSGRPI